MQIFWRAVTSFLGAGLGLRAGLALAQLFNVQSKIPMLILMILGASFFSVLFASSYLFLMHGKRVKGHFQPKHIILCGVQGVASLWAVYTLSTSYLGF